MKIRGLLYVTQQITALYHGVRVKMGQAPGCSAIQWLTPTYTKIHQVLTNPVYAGAYVYGKTRQERYIDDHGDVRQRLKRLPPGEWSVLIHDHHPGFIDWATFEANQVRLAQV
jgi:hypothetical protein